MFYRCSATLIVSKGEPFVVGYRDEPDGSSKEMVSSRVQWPFNDSLLSNGILLGALSSRETLCHWVLHGIKLRTHDSTFFPP